MPSASAGRRPAGPYRALLTVPLFRRLMPLFLLSDLGDGLSTVAVAWLALDLAPGGDGTLAGAALVAYTLPGAVAAPLLGRLLRRLPAARLLAADALLRAVLLGAVPLLHAAGLLTPVRYLLLLGASSLLHAWGRAGKHAVFAPVLTGDLRLAANSAVSTGVWGATVLGPALAGLLVRAVPAAWVIGLDALTFAALAARTLRLPAAPAEPAAPAGPAAVADRGGAARVLFGSPELLGLLAVTWAFNLAYGPVEAALPAFVAHGLGGGPALLGGYWAAFGAGAVLGALGTGLARRLPLWPALLGIVAAHGLAMLPFALTAGPVPSLLGFALAGVAYGPYSALSLTIVQDRSPARALTGVLAARSALLVLASPLGTALGTVLLARTGARALLVGSGGAMVLTAAAGGFALAVRRGRGRQGSGAGRFRSESGTALSGEAG
ncbi:MFS transporter [Kitasatospora sp. NPDC088391]|uniref:MFS transporter n=1 Tax=Kitasatospora sp. NPDC088391 TaxID=3364074 RepID=UPI0037F8823F